MRIIRKPVLCNYYVTYRCNATCNFCDIWERPSPYVTLANATENLRDLRRLGVKVIDFTGGEPLLHRQLPELLRLAKQMGFITTVTTNCLLYPKYAEKLRGCVDMLHFSLDSPIREEHNVSRGVNCYDFFVESIIIAKSLGERPDVLFTVSDSNIHQIEEVWRQFCLPNNLVLILNPIFDYHQVNNRQGISAESLDQLQYWAKQPQIYMNEAFVALRKDGGNTTQRPVCRAGSSTIVISPHNELVLPCYHLGRAHLPIDGQLATLWQSDQVQRLVRQEGRYKECEGCVINCYMQPSFAVELSKYWFLALPSTLKYNLMKGTYRQLFR